MKQLHLQKNIEESLLHGHPWVFHDAIKMTGDYADGEVVELLDRHGAFLARGTVEPRSPLRFRVWTLNPKEKVDRTLLRRRLKQALAFRRATIPAHVTGYRLCHGENDHLPGLQCDLYEDVASLRTDGALGVAWEQRFVEAVQDIVAPKAIVVRNPKVAKGRARLVFGELPDTIFMTEGPVNNQRRYEVDVLRGMKTGFFVDQRDNRDLIGSICAGRKVLNLFAYTGGFSVAAALGGALHTTTVDQSKAAINNARRNFEHNKLDPSQHDFIAGDAFELLENIATTRRGEFDLIIADPPSFAPNRRSLKQAKRAYQRLNSLALSALPPGGLLATASCSSHIREADFLDILARSAAQSGRQTTVLTTRGAAPCHPTRLGFDEGRYLKFLLLGVA